MIQSSHSESDELNVKNDPGKEVDEWDIGGKERHDVSGIEYTQCVHVHPISSNPKETKEAATT